MGVLRHADHQRAAAEPGHQVGVIGVHQRVPAAWAGALRRRSTTVPTDRWRRRCQLLAPEPVDLGRRHPLPVDEARLHRVLRPVPSDDGHGGRRHRTVHPSAARYLGAASNCPRGLGRGTSACPSAGRSCGTRLRGPGSARTCCRTGTCRRVAGDGVPVDRVRRRCRARAGRTAARAFPRRTPRATSRRGATPTRRRARGRRRGPSGPELLTPAVEGLAAHRPEPVREPALPVPGSNDAGAAACLGGTA